MKSLQLGALFVCLLIAFSTANSSVIYSYQGSSFNAFTKFGDGIGYTYEPYMKVTGRIELENPLDPFLTYGRAKPQSFTFSDGVNTHTELNTTSFNFLFTTDSNGDILEWLMSIESRFDSNVGDISKFIGSRNDVVSTNDDVSVFVCVESTDGSCEFFNYIQGSSSEAGSWTGPTVVPLPSSIYLLGSGMMIIFGTLRRKKV